MAFDTDVVIRKREPEYAAAVLKTLDDWQLRGRSFGRGITSWLSSTPKEGARDLRNRMKKDLPERMRVNALPEVA